MTAHGEQVGVPRIESRQAFPQPADQRIDRLIRNPLPCRLRPNVLDDFLSTDNPIGILKHQRKQTVLGR